MHRHIEMIKIYTRKTESPICIKLLLFMAMAWSGRVKNLQETIIDFIFHNQSGPQSYNTVTSAELF